jgi:transcriptional regulator with XRE-family HTH domain
MTPKTATTGQTSWPADPEDSGVTSVGGLSVTLRALERLEHRPELTAIGKLVELRRREKGLTVEELGRLAHVSETALLALECGLRLPNTRDVICLLARVLELPADKLLAAAGLNGDPDPMLSSAVLRFARQATTPERLSPPEHKALGEFLQVLAAG